MRKIAFFIGVLGILLTAAVLGTTPAHAQLARAWVSGVGDDANPCSRTAPCKTFAGAIGKTLAIGAEINCLDPGDFSATGATLAITQSLTIDCSSVPGYFRVTSAVPAITISGSGIVVNLRNLVIDGAAIGTDAISISNAASVLLENVTIQSFTGRGVVDTSSSVTKLALFNSYIVQNGGVGVLMAAASGSGALLQNTVSSAGTYGVATASGNAVTVKNSRADLNSAAGVEGDPGSIIYIVGAGIEGNGIGVDSLGTTTIDNSDITENGTAINGATSSFGNNRIFGNTSAGTAPTPIALK